MILYFSGTGNSKLIASVLAEETNQKLFSMNDLLRKKEWLSVKNETSITVVTPIYAGRIPRVVEELIQRASIPPKTKIYFVVTCSDSMENASDYAEKLCVLKELDFYGMAEIKMPVGYILMFNVFDQATSEHLVKSGIQRAINLASFIIKGERFLKVVHKWSAMSHIINPVFYGAFMNSKGFLTTSACIGCGICVEVCPLNNIKLKNGRPDWGGNCTHCMACISNCPNKAIEFGKKTVGKKRYHCDDFQNNDNGMSFKISEE
ncbi:Ferredoxin-type protein NapF [Eubacterium callanderi]|uniref:EFR1 family ferrodoxin n=1 Tax=Eubacterium callanderi TaxID=53442 RepID=UPI0029FEE2E3|nr:EFR1 family ferrodoxin [Eubacterium callanderi]WPK69210.1 Ferredoxin-type protein NapF [Eubacterium callanderi]WPK73508.1 Ferredoxin-type protein NapF [Eubacterium callanderi]